MCRAGGRTTPFRIGRTGSATSTIRSSRCWRSGRDAGGGALARRWRGACAGRGDAPRLSGSGERALLPQRSGLRGVGAPGAGAAAALLRGGGAVHVPGGGAHHAFPDRANGFCYLNDPVFAVLALRAEGARRVAYVDIDAHHCDGVEFAFRDDPDTLVLSTHEEGRWPRTGALEDRGVGDGGGP